MPVLSQIGGSHEGYEVQAEKGVATFKRLSDSEEFKVTLEEPLAIEGIKGLYSDDGTLVELSTLKEADDIQVFLEHPDGQTGLIYLSLSEFNQVVFEK